MKLGEYVLVAQEQRYIAGKFASESPSSIRLEDVYLISLEEEGEEEEGEEEEGLPLISKYINADDAVAEKLTDWMNVCWDTILDVSTWSKELCQESPAPKPTGR